MNRTFLFYMYLRFLFLSLKGYYDYKLPSLDYTEEDLQQTENWAMVKILKSNILSILLFIINREEGIIGLS